MKLFKGGKSVYFAMLIIVLMLCAMLAAQSFTMEGAVGSSSQTYTANNVVGGSPLTSGVDLGQMAKMDTVACAGLWSGLYASGKGYTMVNALQEPDGTCIVDFMDNDGLYYTQTFSSKSNAAAGGGGGSSVTPSGGTVATPTPAAHNQYTENGVSRTIIY
jgi:hypothetical protein